MLQCNGLCMMQRTFPSSEPARAALAGALAMAVAMGLGRFFYTPVLPGMMVGLGLDAADAGIIAAANFAGYLLGAVLAAYGWAAGHERRLAIGALAATVLLLIAMGVLSSVAALSLIRFLAGLASAFAMIFTTGIVLTVGLAHHDPGVQRVHFSGVGIGIAVSAVLVYLLSLIAVPALPTWRVDWVVDTVVVLWPPSLELLYSLVKVLRSIAVRVMSLPALSVASPSAEMLPPRETMSRFASRVRLPVDSMPAVLPR